MRGRLEKAFYRGAYQDILKITVDSSDGKYPHKEAHFIIASLAYQGRLEEAEHHLNKHRDHMTRSQLCEAHLFLGSSFCRHSQYGKARKYFAKNARAFRTLTKSKDKFCVFQGLGFYRYFSGRFAVALKHAQKGYAYSSDTNFIFGKGFAADLTGHCLVQMGEVSFGLKRLEEALTYMTHLGHSKWKEAFQISIGVYRAQFGIAPKETIPELQKLFRKLSPQDTYSKANLLLEMGRQWTLQGKIRQAKETLNEACRLIYAVKHRRYGVLLSARYANIAYLRGESHEALHLVQSALKELDPIMDVAIEVELRGLESKLLRQLGIPEAAIEARIRYLNQRTGKSVSHRISSRQEGKSMPFLPGEDPLGDIHDSIQMRKREAIEEVLNSGFLVLLYKLLEIPEGKLVMYFDIRPGSLTCFESGEIDHVNQGISPVIRRMAQRLSQGQVTKEELIRTIWKYEYHPLAHDPLIYRSISRFRKLLGNMSRYLEVTHDGYSFHPDVLVYFYSGKQVFQIDKKSPDVSWDTENLNYRQLTILDKAKKQRFIDVGFYRQIFKISEMTARRDLVGLMKIGRAHRIGKGRATRYALEEVTSS